MPKKISNCTKGHLVSVPLPNHGATYTVISHQFVIDYAYQALANAGFGIVDEEYRCTADGQIAQGIYRLNYNSDPELTMMFAWTNSYNKQVKFKCVVGAYSLKTGSTMISGEVGSWVRKHTGTADAEVKATVDDYVANAHMYYNQLVSDKAAMEVVTLNKRKQSQLLGVLFAEYEILTTEQASLVRDQMKKPIHVFANTDSLWAFYNFITHALQSSHPKTWMEDQRILHYFIGTICDFSAPVQQISTPVPVLSTPPQEDVDPNQINLLDAIAQAEAEADLEADQIDEDIRYAKAEEESGTNGSDFDIDLHQSEEVVGDVVEETEVPFDIDEDDDAVLGSILVPIEKPEPVATIEDYLASKNEEEISPEKSEDIFPQEEIVQYTDPVGNTFEAPVVDDFSFDLDFNETETEEKDKQSFDFDF